MQPCRGCKAPTHNAHARYRVVIETRSLQVIELDRLCRRCAAEARRTETFGAPEPWALEASPEILATILGPVTTTWLQGDEHRWALIAQPIRRRSTRQ